MKIIIDTEMKESMEFVREDGTVQPWKKYTVQVDGMEITIVVTESARTITRLCYKIAISQLTPVVH